MAGLRVLKFFGRLAFYLVSLVVVAIVVAAFGSRSKAPLQPWHTVELEGRFTVETIETMGGLDDYLAREEELFAELERRVVDEVEVSDRFAFNRYARGSQSDPDSLFGNFNRSFALEPDGEARCGVLLVHGLTDAPYSMRHLARIYAEAGCYALALRMPGHGTVPGELKHSTWQDWRAAVALGARAVRERIGAAAPLLLAGYSNGGALVVGHALDALDDAALVAADALMLFSPMIGVTPFSRFAAWGEILSRLDYFAQFAWLDIVPEFDPFKYNSFPKNAGHQTFLVTANLRARLQALEQQNRLDEIPPMLTFQSLVDATVSTPAIVNTLYARLRSPGSELVLFDLNRSSQIGPFLAYDHRAFVEGLIDGPPLDYTLALVGNRSVDSAAVVERRQPAEQDEVRKVPLGLDWPQGTYSLSHIAIVFPPEDELYGTREASTAAGVVALGAMNPRGERGVTSVPVANLVRLRHNPFFAYLEQQLRSAIDARLTRGARRGAAAAAP